MIVFDQFRREEISKRFLNSKLTLTLIFRRLNSSEAITFHIKHDWLLWNRQFWHPGNILKCKNSAVNISSCGQIIDSFSKSKTCHNKILIFAICFQIFWNIRFFWKFQVMFCCFFILYKDYLLQRSHYKNQRKNERRFQKRFYKWLNLTISTLKFHSEILDSGFRSIKVWMQFEFKTFKLKLHPRIMIYPNKYYFVNLFIIICL